LSIFSNYAKYYDLLNQGKDYQKEVEYIHSIIQEYKSNAKSILDLGCGTGLHAISFAKYGYNIHGVDQSEKMIALANERLYNKPELKKNPQFAVGDIRNIDIDKSFDVIVSLFHVMSYQTTNEDLKNSISSVANHSKTGSLFIFDCWYGPAVLTDKPYKRTKIFEDNHLLVKRTAQPKMHPSKNLVDVNFDISITDKHSGDRQHLTELHKMRYLFEPELELLLNNYGFVILKTEEWMTRKAASYDSWYVTFICKKL